MKQNAYMAKEAAITIRVPISLKRKLEARAKSERRSLSNQVVYDLTQALTRDPIASPPPGRFLGLFEGSRVPSEHELEEVRSLLWQRLSGRGDA